MGAGSTEVKGEQIPPRKKNEPTVKLWEIPKSHFYQEITLRKYMLTPAFFAEN